MSEQKPQTDAFKDSIVNIALNQASKKKEEPDFSKFKYVLYARKSSEEEGAQERSIPNQIEDCKRFAKSLGLNVVEVITEQKSAKNSGNRPKFTQMLDNITKGKYDAILAWHPDRLARNSLESGMIIDMLDNDIIKDIKMPTTAFENNASGKLLLNILFAMAKEYSEHLSENVSSAHKKNIAKGISSGTPKWGYKRNIATGNYEPDENYAIIKEGWDMRLKGATLNEVLSHWKLHKVCRMTKITRKNKTSHPVYLDDKQAVSTIFRDPFYQGTLIQSGTEIRLTDFYDFQAMVTSEEWDQVQALSRRRAQSTPTAKGKVFLPFRGLVICGFCRKPMTPGASGRKNEKKLYYECRNTNCSHRQTVRARVILDELYRQLDLIEFSEKEYTLFRERVQALTDERRNEMLIELESYKGQQRVLQREFDTLSKGQAIQQAEGALPEAIEAVNQQLGVLRDEITDYSTAIKNLEEKIKCSEDVSQTEKDFLNIVNSASSKMRAGSPVQKDVLARLILLNIVIGNKKEPHFLWKEPFDTIVKRSFGNSGAPD